ncbi:hypothetical protein [Candidatus Palauibacter polyketidifaciens]|uniref:hypothetical protein n=1 Tax=Candidatus Palauibacter polyketidifaciens TaxID=3056740 RepID=UPI00239B5561|nr:hypothetical protein [Candidatus Palauibacter polyketidifaciens]MDE2719317.1 hypothetical protein [Candidatus Palauibacter polyketidifaciens]
MSDLTEPPAPREPSSPREPPSRDPPATLTAAQVSQILKRAAEIDARGDAMTVEELERIAGEAGIDPRATRTAIAELVAEEMPVPVPEPRPPAVPPTRAGNPASPSPGRIIAGGAVGAAFGFIFATSLGGAIAASGATMIYLILRAMQAMKRGSQLDFQLQNFTLWFVSTLILSAAFDVEGLMLSLLCWILTSVIGGLLVRFGPREEEAEDDIPQLEAGGR